MPVFSPEIVQAILGHMNGEHAKDNLVIVRAFSEDEPIEARMVDFDENGGVWEYSTDASEGELRIPWSTTISDRADVRREIVALYDRAAERLGLPAREH